MRNWLLMGACLLGVSATQVAVGQEVVWRTKGQSTDLNAAASNGVTLAKPTPLAVSEAQAEVRPIAFASHTANEAGAIVPARFSETVFVGATDLVFPAVVPPQENGTAPRGDDQTVPPLNAGDPNPLPEPIPPMQPTEAIMFWEEIGGGAGRFYVRAEYLSWWLKGQSLPPLVTTSPPLTPENDLGVLGKNTTILFGNSTQDARQSSGGRITAGFWLDSCQVCGVEGSFFYLGRQNNPFSVNSSTTPVIARPIQIQNLGNLESRELTATPGLSPGAQFLLRDSISIDTPTQFWGAELNLRHQLCCGCNYRVDLLGGFRYLDLQEGLHITEDLTTLRDFPEPSANPPLQVRQGDRFVATDLFDTHNRFYGGQLGVSGELRRGRWVVTGTAKLALGVTQETLDVAGSTTLFQAATGNRVTLPGGLLAQPSNIRHYSRNSFAVAPEVGIKVGYQVTEHINAFVGYNFLYLSNVLRPGDQVDRSIDVTQVPFALGSTVMLPPVTGVRHPVVPLRESDFWAQGVNVGVEIRY